MKAYVLIWQYIRPSDGCYIEEVAGVYSSEAIALEFANDADCSKNEMMDWCVHEIDINQPAFEPSERPV